MPGVFDKSDNVGVLFEKKLINQEVLQILSKKIKLKLLIVLTNLIKWVNMEPPMFTDISMCTS